MKRLVVAGGLAIALFGAGAAALVAWMTGGDPEPARPAAPAAADAGGAPPEEHPPLPLPAEPAARDRVLEQNVERSAFSAFAKGFAVAERTPTSEARLLPALDVLFPKDGPRWTLECRRLVCRVEVDAPAAEWREALAQSPIARQQVDRAAFDPDGAGLAYVELVEAKAAGGPARPEGERVLDALEKELLASEAARGCVAEGPAPGAAEVRLMIDRSGITYRFGSAVDSSVATCLMMRALPDVLGGAAAPADVKRAERKVVVTASR